MDTLRKSAGFSPGGLSLFCAHGGSRACRGRTAALGDQPIVQVADIVNDAATKFQEDRAAAEHAELIEGRDQQADVLRGGLNGNRGRIGSHGEIAPSLFSTGKPRRYGDNLNNLLRVDENKSGLAR